MIGQEEWIIWRRRALFPFSFAYHKTTATEVARLLSTPYFFLLIDG